MAFCPVTCRDGYAKLEKDAKLGLVVICQNKQQGLRAPSKARGREGTAGAAVPGSSEGPSTAHQQQFAMELDFAEWETMKRVVGPGRTMILRHEK